LPSQILLAGFVATILGGTLLLSLPFATTHGISLVDALFTSTSSVCVTGLTVKNTARDFTLFGKVVILLLIQVGGLGYMSLATMLALVAGRKIGMSERILIRESLNTGTLEGVVRLLKRMLIFVFTAEAAGAVVLAFSFRHGRSAAGAAWQGLFHSISAFNNAGFTLFDDGLAAFRGDITVNAVVMLLIIVGGIGFVVVNDVHVFFLADRRKLLLHTRIVLVSTLVLVVTGALLVYFNERKYLFATGDFSTTDAVLSSLFASVTARTAGFNTIDYSAVQPSTIFLTIILMIIGASPGSTGGGIKTTTFSVVIMNIWCTIRGKRDTVIFRQRISEAMISRSLVVLAMAVIFVNIVTLVIIDIEHTGFQKTMFEVVSAFGTVGLSTGDGAARSFCALFSTPSKVIIILTMLAGRLGPLTLFMGLMRQRDERIRYPEGRIMIG